MIHSSFFSLQDSFISVPRPYSELPGKAQKKLRSFDRSFMLALPIFPCSHPQSIVGANELNFCVRDGNRCILSAIVTGLISSPNLRSKLLVAFMRGFPGFSRIGIYRSCSSFYLITALLLLRSSVEYLCTLPTLSVTRLVLKQKSFAIFMQKVLPLASQFAFLN